jgi:hypothetical protein
MTKIIANILQGFMIPHASKETPSILSLEKCKTMMEIFISIMTKGEELRRKHMVALK